MDPDRQCTATSKSTGRRCGKPAIIGGTVCAKHGGSAPQVKAKAAARATEERAAGELAAMGRPVPVNTAEAVLAMVAEANGNVIYLRGRVQQLGDGQLYGVVKVGEPKAEPHVLVRMYDAERERLVHWAKTAHDMGIEERRIRMAEDHGDQIGRVVMALVGSVVRWLSERGTPGADLAELEAAVPGWIRSEVSKMRAVDVGSEPAHG